MATIKMDSYNLENKCIPRIDDVISSLKSAKSYLANNSLPSDFAYRNTLNNSINNLDSCINKLTNLRRNINKSTDLIDDVLQDAMRSVNTLSTKVVNER